MRKSNEATLWDRYLPYSADPLDFDDTIHHLAMRPVLAPLVSQYKLGEFVGIVAKSWTSSSNFSEWRFEIRRGLSFSDGVEITPSAVLQSFKRVIFLMVQRNSRDGLVENLVGIDVFKKLSGELPGLHLERIQGAEFLVFKLKKPVKDFLDIVNFGIYSICSPNDFDLNTGQWKDVKRVTASGAYKVTEWSENKFRIELRAEFPVEKRHPNAFSAINFTSEVKEKNSADIIYAFSIDEIPNKNFHFVGGALSGILYLACRTWHLDGSPCEKISIRRKLRSEFYKSLKKTGTPYTRSFFPLSMQGISEPVESNQNDIETLPGKIIKFRKYGRATSFAREYKVSMHTSIVSSGGKAEEVDISAEDVVKEYDDNLRKYKADYYILPTGILVDQPKNDIRFMFKSKEGIRLPDADGSIHKILDLEDFEPQIINQKIWDQAIVWPITHFSFGLFINEKIDISSLNLVLPPSDLSWIGKKN